MTATIIPRPPTSSYPVRSLSPRAATQRIMLHCTATRASLDVKFADLYRWHVTENKWSDIGYHYLIELDGTIQACRGEQYVGAGCSGQNHDTIHISYAGGLDTSTGKSKDTRTPAQIKSMIELIKYLAARYNDLDDVRDIVGHNQFAAKDCPCFSVPDWVASVVNDNPVTDPEPGMPELDNLIQYVKDLEARVAALEAWRKS